LAADRLIWTLTDEDLLETGVSVMARPPGKRNSTIHLLSGGEKALTAVALVFAIFQLNPGALLHARRGGRAAG
jgi:chromosome segregation ATPase